MSETAAVAWRHLTFLYHAHRQKVMKSGFSSVRVSGLSISNPMSYTICDELAVNDLVIPIDGDVSLIEQYRSHCPEAQKRGLA